MAIIRQLAVIQVALENDQVRLAQVEEQIGRLGMQVPECKALCIR